MSWSDTTEQTRTTLQSALQPVLTDLLGLSLLGKQVHWTVVGRDFASVHELVDDHVTLWRTWADRIAERMVALDVVPDGQPHALMDTAIPKLPTDWHDTHTALAVLADALDATIRRIRQVRPTIAETDPVTDGILLDLVERLEQQRWMVRAHLA